MFEYMFKLAEIDTIYTSRLFFFSEYALVFIIIFTVSYLALNLSSLTNIASKKTFTNKVCIYRGYSLLIRAAILLVISIYFEEKTFVTVYFISTPATRFFQVLVLVSSAFILHHSGNTKTLLEYPILMSLRIWFLLLLLSANHFLTVFLALVGFSINLYVLIMRFDSYYNITLSYEASIKYFYLSTFSTALILISFTLLFVTTLTWNFSEYLFFSTLFFQNHTEFFVFSQIFLVALICIILGFVFKLSAFPANFWAPEVYEGSATQITAFIIRPVKIACLRIFARLLVSRFPFFSFFWSPVISFAACGSLIIGAWGALTENKFKRFIAYSSINQRGFRLLGLLGCNTEGIQACFVFLIIYILTNIVLFYFVLRIQSSVPNQKFVFLTDFARLDDNYILVRLGLGAVFFSLSGIPPFAGFFSKYYLLVHTFQEGYFLALFFGIFTSLVSTFYYLRRIKILWFVKLGKYFPRTFYFLPSLFFWQAFVFLTLFFLTSFFFFNASILQITKILAQTCFFPTA